MAKKKIQRKPTPKKPKPVVEAKKSIMEKAPVSDTLTKSELEAANFAFSKANYRLMLIGLLLIGGGFLIMSLETAQHGFGFLGLTLGPVVTFVGFMFEIFAILHTPKGES